MNDKSDKKRLVAFLTCLLLLSFHLHAEAATLFQWSFDGPPGSTLSSSADSVAGCLVVTKFNDATLSAGATNTIQYGPPNPWYNTNGTSADFLNTAGVNDPGVGLFVNDTGMNSPLDISTLTNLTIEAFVYPYDIRQAVIIRKYGGTGVYYIDIRSDGNFGFRLKSASQDLTDQLECNDLPYTTNQWYHVAMVWNGSAVTFYVNGVQSHDLGSNHLAAIPFSGPIADSTYSLGIGTIVRDNANPPANSGQFFFGRIDEIRISDTALSPSQFLLNQTMQAMVPADHLAMGQQPGNTAADQVISPAVTVRVMDQFGNPAASTTNVTVAIGNNPDGGTLSGTVTVAANHGVAIFSDLSIDKPGNGYTLIASATALTGTNSVAFNITSRAWQSGLAFIYSNGTYTMPFRLYLPLNYSAATHYPLVLFLHGSGEYGTDNIAQVENHIAGLIARTYSDYPAILVAPQLDTSYWSSSTNPDDLTLGILAQVRQYYAVDERRIYLTGLSAGGYGTTDYAINYPTMFAAIAPMSGAEIVTPNTDTQVQLSRIPTWLFCGGADTLIYACRDYYMNVNVLTNITFTQTNYGYPTAVSGLIRYTEFTGLGHDIWELIYGATNTDFYDWMFSQTRPPAIFTFTAASANRGTFVFGGSNNVPFATGYLLTSTNLQIPLSQWLFIATNWCDVNGNLMFTNDLDTNANPRFYILKLP